MDKQKYVSLIVRASADMKEERKKNPICFKTFQETKDFLVGKGYSESDAETVIDFIVNSYYRKAE